MAKTGKVVFMIPCLRPDEKFTGMLARLTVLLALPENTGLCHSILVVDDGSGPEYRPLFDEAEKAYSCVTLRHAVNLGKGRALKTGMNHMLLHCPEAVGVVSLDADGQHDPADTVACAKALCGAPASLIMGCRDFNEKQVPFHNRAGNKITRVVFRFLCGVKVSDTQTGLRGIPRAFAEALMTVPGERFEFEMNMLMECKEREVAICEVPIKTIYLENNKSSHFNPLVDAARIYLVFLKYLFSSASSSIIDLLLFSLFVALFNDWLPKSYILAATACARVLSSIFNYLFNKRLVFHGGGGATAVVKYYLLVVVTMLVSGVSVSLIHRIWPVAEVGIKVVVDLVLFFINFQLQRNWVFRKKKVGEG